MDRVEIRRLLKNQKTKTFIFPCDRWFAKDEDDRAIVRDLVPEKVVVDQVDPTGHVQSREKDIRDRLESRPTRTTWMRLTRRSIVAFLVKKYEVDVYTGNEARCGTNANVFVTIYGDRGDTGERALDRSETHRDKFERNQLDRFRIESADLGNIYKLKIRHDNSGLFPDWFLSRVEVKDDIRTFVFYCEQWLAKGKGDSALERVLREKVEQRRPTKCDA